MGGLDKPRGAKPPRGDRRKQSERWRQVLHLGEQLLALGGGNEAQPSHAIPTLLAAQRDLIVETTSHLLQAEAALWLAESTLPFPVGEPKGGGGQAAPRTANSLFSSQSFSPLMQSARQERQVCCEVDGEPRGLPAGTAPPSTAVAAPLLIYGEDGVSRQVLGVLQVERPEGEPFDPAEVDLLEGLASQAAIALQASRQMAVGRWRLEQLSLVRKVSGQIANVRDLDELARRVTDLILHTFDYYFVAIFTLEPGQDLLHFRASAGPRRAEGLSGGLDYSPVLAIHLGEGMIGHAALAGQEVVANDVGREARYRYSDALPETRSEVTLPLKIEDRVLGVLDVQSNQPDDFKETDLLVLQALAGNIAIAIEGAHLYSALRRRAEQLAMIGEISRAIASILDTEKLLNEVVDLIHRRFGYPFVHLFDVHPGRRKIFYQAGSGPRSRALRRSGFCYDLDDPQGIIPWVARNGETVLANEVESEPRYRPSPLPPANTRSELAVPLIFGGEVLGVLDVQSDLPNAFGEEDRFLFEALADSVALAMRNAFLYRSERWRRQVADSLREVAGLLSADMDLDRVLDAILAELERNIPSDAAAIWLLEEGGNEADLEDKAPRLDLAAVHGAQAADLDGRPDLGGIQAEASAWLAEALRAEQPMIREDGTLPEPLGAALDFPPDYSAIAAPLRVGDQRLGVLVLANREARRYGSEARTMTSAFASYASVAIENTRLYEAAHEQAWVSTVLLQVAEATQSLTNLSELLVTVVNITPMLVGVKACALYMLDDDGAFVPAASAGLTSDGRAEFERWRFAPGDAPALDRVTAEKAPMILTGGEENGPLPGILLGDQASEFAERRGAELLVLVPMLARGEPLGVFLIDYSNGAPASDDLEALFDEELAILQGIAHQTAIAVENIRLIKAQKEEAYVSVALLQVAQAVVSTVDLDETLGAIVRITPILVGVKRTIIYLWDPIRQVFHLAQAYGIGRNIPVRTYPPGEFPLLEAVFRSGRLAAYPMAGEPDNLGDDPDAWSSFTAPAPESTEAILQAEDCLLLALPLTVQGECLGVMLVEEPDLLGGEGTGGGANRRLRSKRLEIITGISQQVALAIQNERFQHERLERERLDREMQLAREIQVAFLPQGLPELPGWELSARWRTARQVGGDFYDVFELPGDRLGMVIADVADKGMPAALFMTLVRTLVRAAVQEIDSPAAVLARVNDVLAPDAQEGMFVTLVYAVLSLATGEVVYANAGHNQPLLVQTGAAEVERLEKGGMALGVVEGSRVTAHGLALNPGDALFFYTDGVTEAFSPQGDMFGEEGLREALRCASSGSADDLLEVVDAAVLEFLGDSPPADDLTLLVLRRAAS